MWTNSQMHLQIPNHPSMFLDISKQEAASFILVPPPPLFVNGGTPFWGRNAFVQEKQPANRRKGGGDQLAAINPRKEQPKRDACVYTEMAGDGQS
jgi:hypothetical protein